jgi:hypothetical protein
MSKTTYTVLTSDIPAIKHRTEFKTINAVHKQMVKEVGTSIRKPKQIICLWEQVHEGSSINMGYRIFTLEPKGQLTYNRFPLHDY